MLNGYHVMTDLNLAGIENLKSEAWHREYQRQMNKWRNANYNIDRKGWKPFKRDDKKLKGL